MATYIRQLCRPFLINSLCLNTAIAALEDDEFVQNTVELVRREKKRIYLELDNLNLSYWKAEGNFILLKPPFSAEEFTNQLLEEGIMVRPVANFGAPGCVRVTVGNEEANTAFLKALKSTMNNIH